MFGKIAGILAYIGVVLGVLTSTDTVSLINEFMAIIGVSLYTQHTVGKVIALLSGLYMLFTKALQDADHDGVPDIFEKKS